MDRLYVLFYDYVSDVLERRPPYREAHLELLRAEHEAGRLAMAGALGDPAYGAAFVFRTADAATSFLTRDPYVSAGLVTAHRVDPWSVVVP